MFIYLDESGHTGRNNSDPDQPIFSYLALLTKYNVDFALLKDFVKLKEEYGFPELHGAETPELIEVLASRLVKMLRASSSRFFLSVVEKNMLAYAKLYDTLFDNVENKGVRSHVYQVRPFRLMILNNICAVTPIEVAQNFYENCLLASDEKTAIDVLVKTCQAILTRIENLDDRSKQIIGDALRWAEKYPGEITAFNTRKTDRWRHLPHVASFLPMMSMMSRHAQSNRSPIQMITHDRQDQLRKIIKQSHALAADASVPSVLDLRENGILDFRSLKESVFQMKDSTESIGLQLTDICLYVLNHQEHIHQNVDSLPNTFGLMEYITSRTEPYALTTRFFRAEVESLHHEVMNSDLTSDQLGEAKSVIDKIEADFQKQEKHPTKFST